MKVAIASDHGGFEARQTIKALLASKRIEVEDLGCPDKTSVDYPDFAAPVASRVAQGEVDWGVLICTAGIGMSIAANRFPGIRAALCFSPNMAKLGRTHNNANILVLGGGLLSANEITAIVDEWLKHPFSNDERHARRLNKIEQFGIGDEAALAVTDPDIADAVRLERNRQQVTLNLIASENYVSAAVRAAQGSVMTNKYAEGYPNKRWYNGCRHVDTAESLAIGRAAKLFGAQHANVQPHCGTSANMAVYFAALKPGDTIMAMNLSHGGHLSHGNPVNFSGRLYTIVPYSVSAKTGQLDYDEIEALAKKSKPRLIVAGASAYPRLLDFKRFRDIADQVGAYLLSDMAHIGGLVAAGCHPSPVPYSEFVTTTTHKTLRGPRGGMVLCHENFAVDIDKQMFPGIQGGPLMHVIAAKAVCFHEALQPAFKDYGQQILRNAARLAEKLTQAGLSLVSGGTDNHLMLVDLNPLGITGKDAATALDKAGIIVNKNTIPFDTRSPFVTSGIRIGTPAATTRGMKEPEMDQLAKWLVAVLKDPGNETLIERTRREVAELCAQFPAP